MFGGGQPLPKGDLEQLWKTLGVQFDPLEVIWQDYAPEAALSPYADAQWVFIDNGNGAQDPLSSHNTITSGMNQLLLLYPGSIRQDEDSKLEFDALCVTGGKNSGTVETSALQRQAQNRQVFSRVPTSKSYILAAQIRGDYVAEDQPLEELLAAENAAKDSEAGETEAGETEAGETEAGDSKASAAAETNTINVVLVADVDWMLPDFFYIREGGDNEVLPATQNVTFVLNAIDALAGEERFIEIRKRTRKHRTLTKIDNATKANRETKRLEEDEAIQEIEQELSEANQRFQEKIDAVDQLQGISAMAKQQRKAAVQQREQERLQADIQSIETLRSRKLKQINYDLEQEIKAVQGRYKMFAILIPPIPPLLVALYVFFRRREAEREGIVKQRLR
jgi:ABC-2 type transport system permease protein